ncbi:ParB/RepB/Spo0J family partition protein [Candidatus Uabimicrobium amorphum]|uniref:Chromosome partitioning protein ParB n=1 Tax=Uabimicrobium amorphum TaxID=2596890 RepID=A0A5S9IL63_UABAM|nr:ParB/RepB/Spo0J family partition protein [Candidatus Uabimicrobium amorphum]BBM82615.1 chromosome partitioning protein ParB [Candidatus Uabimicrobium amorphum]
MSDLPKSLVEEVKISRIRLEPDKYRHFALDIEGIERLTEDIREKGLLVPVLLWRRGEDNILIGGYHRIECAKKLGWKTIPARIVFFSTPEQALEASVQTNAQDQYTFSKRSWFDRFRIAENVLRNIYEKKAQQRQRRGVKVKKKYRVDELLARAVGLSWSYVKYAQMRKIYTFIHEKEIDECVVKCLRQTKDPKIQLWLEVFEMHKAQKIPQKHWNEFVNICEEIVEEENSELRAKLDGHLKHLKGLLRKKSQVIESQAQHSATFLLTWTDGNAHKVLDELKKTCAKANWIVKVDGRPKRERDVFSQKVTLTPPQEE